MRSSKTRKVEGGLGPEALLQGSMGGEWEYLTWGNDLKLGVYGRTGSLQLESQVEVGSRNKFLNGLSRNLSKLGNRKSGRAIEGKGKGEGINPLAPPLQKSPE